MSENLNFVGFSVNCAKITDRMELIIATGATHCQDYIGYRLHLPK